MRHPHLDPLCDPSAYELAGRGEGKKVGVLLVHGFTASATETRPFAEFLSEKTGWACRGALLAGHGRTIDDLQETDRYDWLESAQSELVKLLERGCEHCFLAGVSS